MGNRDLKKKSYKIFFKKIGLVQVENGILTRCINISERII